MENEVRKESNNNDGGDGVDEDEDGWKGRIEAFEISFRRPFKCSGTRNRSPT